VRAEGLEPPRAFAHQLLRLARLPFRHARGDADSKPLLRPPEIAGTAKEPQQAATGACIFRGMAQQRTLTPGYVVVYPNREKASSKTTKAVIVLIMLVSVALMLIVTIGGWSKLQGLKPVNFVWILAYLIMGYYIFRRWARGLLPITAGLAILLLMMTVIAGLGAAGTSWFDRHDAGFAGAQSLFGGAGLSADVLGFFTLLIAPVQVLLIFFAMLGFSQGWNVEMEVPEEEARRRGYTPVETGPPKKGGPQPAAA
jgi:hypothetical protein